MKTSNIKNLKKAKYLAFLVIISFISCSFSECGTGYSTPPDPVIDVTYSPNGTGAKFYMTSNERISLKSISVEMTNFNDFIKIGYPYLICEPGSKHIIKEYSNISSGQKWTFTFSGMSLTTGINFAVSKSIYINN